MPSLEYINHCREIRHREENMQTYSSKDIPELKKKLAAARKEAKNIEDYLEKAIQYAETVKPFLTSIRYHCDKLELTVDDTLWPLAKYRELLFVR